MLVRIKSVENVVKVEKEREEQKGNDTNAVKQKEEEKDERGQEEKNNLLINLLNYFLDKDGIQYSPSLTTYLAIILGSTTLFITSCG